MIHPVVFVSCRINERIPIIADAIPILSPINQILRFMIAVTRISTHVRRYHRHYDSSGHVWQGRFKAFPIQSDNHLLTVMRYVERNPVRAITIPVRKAQNWKWSSAGTPTSEFEPVKLHNSPAKQRSDWLDWVNKPLTEAERSAMHQCINRGRPFGSENWQNRTAKRLGLESTMRPRGRPRSS